MDNNEIENLTPTECRSELKIQTEKSNTLQESVNERTTLALLLGLALTAVIMLGTAAGWLIKNRIERTTERDEIKSITFAKLNHKYNVAIKERDDIIELRNNLVTQGLLVWEFDVNGEPTVTLVK